MVIDNYWDHTTINLSNHYLTMRCRDHYKEHIAFTKDINPKGVLMRAVTGGQYICSKQNVVHYRRLLHTKEGAVQ